MTLESRDALKVFGDDEDIRVILFRANGPDFGLGYSPKSIGADSSLEPLELMQELEQFSHLAWDIMDMPKPVMAAVQGRAYAGGAGVATRSDITIMAEDAELGFTAISFGLPCVRAINPLVRSVGWKKALEWTMTAEPVSAQESLARGLVNKLVPREKLDKEAIAFANKLISKSPLALAATKRAWAVMRDMTLKQADEYATLLFNVCSTSKDGQEAVSAFLEGREPKYHYKGVGKVF
jgi:enoyl-CoA hydratase/carnithine racemase